MNSWLPPSASRRGRQSAWASPQAVLETVVLTLAVPGVGWLVDRTDPLMLHRSFSWLVVVPILVGMRHGLILGCASAIGLDAAVVFAWRAHAFGVDRLPSETVVCLLALSMVAGQYCNVWTREIRKFEARSETLQKRLVALTRAHAVLELSHDRLRDERPEDYNLLGALQALRDGSEVDRRSPALEERLMDLLVRFCALDVASLHAVDARGRFEVDPIAVIGRPQGADPNDPLLQHALATRKLVHVAEISQASADESNLLAAVPLIEAAGLLRAVLCVQSMPFMAFHRRNLEALVALGGHWADLTAAPALPNGIDRERLDLRRTSALAENDLER
jgi:hypothetical protein